MPRLARAHSSKTIIDPEKRVRNVSFYIPIAKDILAGIANVFLGAIVDNALAEISAFDFLRDVISDKIAKDGAAFVTQQFRKSLEEDELWG